MVEFVEKVILILWKFSRFLFSAEFSSNIENSTDDNEYNTGSVDNATNKQSRQRFKRQAATDVIPLVEFHDALSQSATYTSDVDQSR